MKIMNIKQIMDNERTPNTENKLKEHQPHEIQSWKFDNLKEHHITSNKIKQMKSVTDAPKRDS